MLFLVTCSNMVEVVVTLNDPRLDMVVSLLLRIFQRETIIL